MNLRDKPWPWFAVVARGGRERHAKVHLEGAGYQCYLPLLRCARRWSDRTKEIQLPLFPGYLFCRMDPHNRLPVLMAPGVMHIVGVGKTPVAVDENEITAIERAERSSLAMAPWPYPEMGGVARIEEGPLKGLTGVVVRIKSGLKLVLSVSLLQRSVAVEIDRRWIASNVPPRSAVNLGFDERQGLHAD